MPEPVLIRVGAVEWAQIDPWRAKELCKGRRWTLYKQPGRPARVARLAVCEGAAGARRRWQFLAREVARAGAREVIIHRDGDRLNCQESNLLVLAGSVREVRRKSGDPDRRVCWEVRVVIGGRVYGGGRWPSREWADDIRAQLAAIAREARADRWDRRAIREAVDRAICRIRPRNRQPVGQGEV